MSRLFYLFLYLSLYACSARPLVIVNNEKNKDMEHEKQLAIGSQLNFNPSFLEGLQGEAAVSNIIAKAAEVSGEKNEDTKVVGLAWNESSTSSPEQAMEKTSQAKYLKKLPRRVLKSTPSDAEERVDSKEGDTVEDVVEMDYAQPHRKPPIHNKET